MTQVQLDIFSAIDGRDKGIKAALDNANRVDPGWGDKVYNLLKDFIKVYSGPFQFEDFRMSISGLIAEPPNKRAYGAIAARAAREGLITRVGYAPVKNVDAHRAFATVWKRT